VEVNLICLPLELWRATLTDCWLVGWVTSESVCSLCRRVNFPCEKGGSHSGLDWRKVPSFSSSGWFKTLVGGCRLLWNLGTNISVFTASYPRIGLRKHIFCCMASNPDSHLSKSYPRRTRDSVVSKVTYLRIWRSGVRIPTGTRDLSLLRNVQPSSGAPHSLLFNWYRWLLPGGKTTGCEVDHLYITSRLRISGVLPPLIHCAFMACIGTTLPEPWPARSLLTVVTKLSRFCYFVLRRSMFFLLRSYLRRIVRPNWGTPNFMADLSHACKLGRFWAQSTYFIPGITTVLISCFLLWN